MSRTKRGVPAAAQDPSKPRLTTSAMVASLAGADQRTSPAPFGRARVELGRTRPEILGLTADLAKYTDLHVFAQAYPDRFYQMGMAEQNLMLTAAGLAHEGFIPSSPPTPPSPPAAPSISSARASPRKACR